MRLALPSVLFVALLLPTANAELTAQADGPEAPLAPEGEVGEAVFTVGVDCLTLWTRDVVTLLLDAVADEGLTVSGPTDATFHKNDCADPDGWAHQEHPYELTVAQGLRAGEPLRVAFTATLPPSATDEGESVEAESTATPAYQGMSQVRVAQQIAETSKDAHTFTVHVENEGNDVARYAFSILEAADGVAVDLPAPFTLEPGAQRETDFAVRVADPWGQTTVRVGVTASQAGTGDGAQGLITNVLLRNGDAVERVTAPGPGALLGLGAVAVAAHLARRR